MVGAKAVEPATKNEQDTDYADEWHFPATIRREKQEEASAWQTLQQRVNEFDPKAYLHSEVFGSFTSDGSKEGRGQVQVSKLQWLWAKAIYLFAVVGLLGAGYCAYAIGWVAWRDVNDFYTMRRWVATEMNKQREAAMKKPVDPFAVPK